MRKLIEASFVSMDGVVENPQEWALPLWDAANKQHTLDRMSEIDAFLFGRKTYEIFAEPLGKGDEYYDKIYSLHKFVVSSQQPARSNVTVIKGDIATEILKIKNQPGKNIMKYGTSQLDQILIKHNLVDEFRFTFVPVVVGSGRRLFEGVDISGLKLKVKSTTTFLNGLVLVTYVPEVARSKYD
jgi:dihydrofolate reductase